MALKSAQSPAGVLSGIRRANYRIFARSLAQAAEIGATVMTCYIQDGRAAVTWAGDSRCLLIRDGQVAFVTEDHSEVAALVRQGTITPTEALVHPRRNIITKSLGEGKFIEPATAEVELRRGDRLLLCTDGLHGVVHTSQLVTLMDTAKGPEEAVVSLVNLAAANDSKDNITVVTAFL